MADSFDQFETLLRENIEAMVVDLVLEDDDALWALMGSFDATAIGGRRADGAAGYEAEWKVRIQRGGRIAARAWTGNTQIQAGSAAVSVGQSADAKYLDPAHTPLRGYAAIKMYLKRLVGNVTCNRMQVLGELITTPIESLVADYTEDAIYRLRKQITNWGWGDGTSSLAQINLAAGYAVGEGSNRKECVVDGGTAFRFAKGDKIVSGTNADPRVAIAGSTGGNPPAGVMVVTDVDPYNRTVTLESIEGEGTITLVDNCHLMYWETFDFSQSTLATQTMACEGIESLLINTGTYPGTSYTVQNVSELAAFVEGSESALVNPEPEILAAIIDRITDAGMRPPPVLISEQSVKTLYAQLERQSGAIYSVPQGAAFSAGGGIAGARFQHGDMTFAWLASSLCRPGAVVGIDPAVWKKFIPLGDRTIRWVVSQGGGAGISGVFRPVTEGRQLTEMWEAPFETAIQFGTENPRRQFRRIGFNSQRSLAA